MDLTLIFNSVMPRAYFVQFLEQLGKDSPEEGEIILDCLDLYQEFQILLNALDFIKAEIEEIDSNRQEGESSILGGFERGGTIGGTQMFTSSFEVSRLIHLLDCQHEELPDRVIEK